MTTSKSKEAWEENTLRPAVKRTPQRQASFTTTAAIAVDALYTPADLVDFDYERDLGYPGEFPFTRGVQAAMYRSRLWTVRQYGGFATAEESNRRYRYLLEQGQTGLSVAFDLPTQLGFDSDHPLAEGEVGKVGVAISSLADMETLLNGIPLEKVSTSMTINATAPLLLAMYVAVARQQGVESRKLSGTIQNDILKEYIARGTYIFPPAASLRLVTDVFQYASEHLPLWNTISISGYHMREAGATATQELAFTLANATTYVQAAIAAGLDVDAFAGRLSFFFNGHSNFFEEIAKFRAARRMWAHIMRDRFQARQPRSWMLRFHTQTGGSTLTAQQPDNNIVRATIESLAAVLGGTQSLHTSSRDEAHALPSVEAAQISLRTQQIIAHESGAADTIDPLAGSYFVEWLTNRVEAEANRYLERIEALGGVLAAIEAGFMQREIQDSAYRYQREIDSGQRVVVGVNRYTSASEPKLELLRVDPAVLERQVARLLAVRQRRDSGRVAHSLQELAAVAAGTGNTMPAILACVESYATLGEICDVLRGVFGEQKEVLVL